MTSIECLAIADRMDISSHQCARGSDRDGYSTIAEVWRRSASYALQQEEWTILLLSSQPDV